MTGTCQVCGLERAYVQTRLGRDGEQYTAVSRCVDRVVCRTVLEAAGGRWDVGEFDTKRGPRGFTEAHRIVFAAAAEWRKRQASS